MHQFMLGMIVMGAAVAGLIFLRFWRKTRDRLFGIFAVAFWLLALNWSLLVLVHESEYHFALYGLRLLAFSLIVAGIIDKNRPGRRRGDGGSGKASPPRVSSAGRS